ncbi:MAG: hypothetical protein ACKVOU_08820 [Cytophagales bacterium]
MCIPAFGYGTVKVEVSTPTLGHSTVKAEVYVPALGHGTVKVEVFIPTLGNGKLIKLRFKIKGGAGWKHPILAIA